MEGGKKKLVFFHASAGMYHRWYDTSEKKLKIK
jgi:hypothetical protein